MIVQPPNQDFHLVARKVPEDRLGQVLVFDGFFGIGPGVGAIAERVDTQYVPQDHAQPSRLRGDLEPAHGAQQLLQLFGLKTQIYADGTLYDNGTIIQSGTGDFGLHSDNVTPTTLMIESGGSYLIDSDAGINNLYNTNVIDNAGTIRKTRGTGTSTLAVQGQFINTGTIEADSGTLRLAGTMAQVSKNALTSGTWNALNGSTLAFPSGTSITTNQTNITLDGSGATIL